HHVARSGRPCSLAKRSILYKASLSLSFSRASFISSRLYIPRFYSSPFAPSARAALQQLARAIQLGGEHVFVGQGRAVLRGQHFIRQSFKCVACDRLILFSTQDQPDRRILITPRPVLTRVVEVQVHLP